MTSYRNARHLAMLSNKLGVPTPVPKQRKPRNNEESREQKALIKWWRVYCRTRLIPEFALHSIPNGGRRDPVAGRILKDEGLRAGVPDLFLAFPRNGFNGLYIEMKAAGGVLSSEQIGFIHHANSVGYRAVTCHSCAEAIEQIECYLKVRDI